MSDTNRSHHDRFLRKAFARLPLAREFLRHYLPKHVRQLVDFATLAQGKDIHVKDNLKQEITDLLYSVNFAGKPGYLYVLIEHSSTSSPLLPFRLLKYMVAIMDDHLQNSKSKTLPVIYPLIFYTGKRPYRHSTDLYDLFGKDKRLARSIYNKPFALIDLNHVSDQELSGFQWFGLIGLSMKYVRTITVLPNLKKYLMF